MTGFICLDKPEGITSFTAVNKLRRICNIKKAGHTGTLDPMATGVLPIMLGGATRFSDFIPSHEKAYEAEILLGIETDTLDITGTVLATHNVAVNKDDFLQALNSFVGEIDQVPPMYSAVSQNGTRLYKLARQGIEVERPSRKVTIFSAQLLSFDLEKNTFTISVACSAGTYIRSLAHDIGKKLGCGAVLKSLRRTSANGFTLTDCVSLEQLEALALENRLDEITKSVDLVLAAYPRVFVSEAQSARFKNGGALFVERIKNLNNPGLFRVYSPDEKLLGLGRVDPGGDLLQIARLLIDG